MPGGVEGGLIIPLSDLSGINASSTASEVATAIASLTEDDELQALANVIYGVISTNSITGIELTESTGEDAETYTAKNLSGGYYLVYDDVSKSTAANDSAMKYILQIVGNTTVNDKTTGAPTIEKTITSDNVIGNGESNTAYFGDTVDYQITVTVPSTISQYDSYALTVYDKLEGLSLAEDFTSNGVMVTVYTDSETVGAENSGTKVDSSYYTVSTSGLSNDYSFSVNFNDILAMKNSASDENYITISSGYKIVITYSATVSASASTGTTANTNETYATYSNDPKSTSTDTTVTDTTYTYITSLEVTKQDGDNQGLAKAKFSLYKAVAANYKYDASASTNYVSTDTVKYYAYDSSSKTMVEITSENASTLATDEITVYIQIDDEEEAKETSTGSGTYVAKFGDLSAGGYVLVETTTPDGYNTADPVFFTINAADNSEGADGSSVSWTVTDTSGGSVSVESGVYKTTVVNNAGSELPSTGGIGTTIFYVVGAILVLGAAVILVTRRRMANR